MKKKTALIISLFLIWGGVLANTDSLRRQLTTVSHDSLRVKTLFALGNAFIDGPSDSLLYYYFRSLDLITENLGKYPEQNAEYLSFKRLELRARLELGIEYFFISEYDKALDYYFDAAEVAKELNDCSHLSECYGEIGILYKNQGRYDTALIYQQKALEIALTLDEPDWVAICNNNIGNIYKAKGFYSIATDYYLKALRTFEEMNQPRRVSTCMHSVGTLFFEQQNYLKAMEYYERALAIALQTGDRIRELNLKMAIGNTLAVTGQSNAAKKNYFEVLQIFDSTGYQHGLDDCYKLMGIVLLEEQNTDSAGMYFEKALKISRIENDLTNMAEIFGKQGIVYMKQGKYNLAKAVLGKSDSLAMKLGAPAMVMEASNNLYRLHLSMGNSEDALEHYVRYATMKDSLFKDAQYRTITEMEIKYETVKSEKDIAVLRQKTKVQELIISRRNRLLWSAAAILIFVIAGGYFYYQNRRLKAVQQASELENRLLRAQMNPHFIFNSLIAIQGFIYEKKPVEAGDFLAKFADLVRLTLENSRSEFVLLQKEIGMLQVYLELQQLRFDHKFGFRVTVDEDIDPQAIKIPPMLAQPFIENAVEHGIRRKADIGFIKVLFKRVNENLQVVVEDDGIGRDAAMKFRKKDKPQSLAISITRDRLKVLSKKHKEKFDFQIHDLFDEKNQPCGTRVKFAMPVEEG